ncbi:unnamed protein product [Cylicocyclus nassatus]|uniref:DNA2/NAM7 helicase-like C-terminal domain-containing protein n=1 Tax=Cylicocyclus nassatus TaxID=53992 RepID=A0AA36DNH2_CYLNA|nr:unnamed protein product [Cylicocyclus nassatus]
MTATSAEFLDEYKRLNVALTRSRHGLLVLGHTESLWKVRSWTTILRWADERHAIIPATDLGQYLPVE